MSETTPDEVNNPFSGFPGDGTSDKAPSFPNLDQHNIPAEPKKDEKSKKMKHQGFFSWLVGKSMIEPDINLKVDTKKKLEFPGLSKEVKPEASFPSDEKFEVPKYDEATTEAQEEHLKEPIKVEGWMRR